MFGTGKSERGSLAGAPTIKRSAAHIVQRLELAIVGAGYGVFELDLQTGRITWDAEMHRIYGTSPETFTPTRETWRAMVHPEDREFSRGQFDVALTGIATKLFENRIVRQSDGAIRFIESTGRMQHDEDGKPLMLVGLSRDITDRKMAEFHNVTVKQAMTMIASKVALEDILEFIISEVESTRLDVTCSIFVLDDTGERFATAAGKKLRVFFEKCLQGVKLSPDIGTCGAAVSCRARAITLDTQTDPKWERCREVAKEHGIHSVWSEPIMVGSRVLGAFAMYHRSRREPNDEDVQTLEACAKLAALAIQNSQTEKSLAIQQAQLLSSVKMAALGEMASGIAHEINNPLTIIVGKAWQLKKMAEDGEFDEDVFGGELGRIVDTSNRIAKVIKGLQSFSRNAERDPLEVISASQAVDDALELSKERFRNHGIELRIAPYPKSPVKISARPAQLTQVLLNLLNNAFDAVQADDPRHPEKWVEVTIQTDGDVAKISVTDSGPGFSEAVGEKIMQPFFTTKEIGKGTGLGLSISKGIVEDHQGRLFHDGSTERTRFVVELPVVRRDGAQLL